MLKLHVPELGCGHCAATIAKAVNSVDSQAVVDVDLNSKTVSIKSDAEAATISRAIEDAGYENRAE